MKRVGIRRVAFDLSVYERLKFLIPLGERISLLMEDDQLARLSQPPPLAAGVDLEQVVSVIEGLKAKDAKDFFSIKEPKAMSSRITIVFKNDGDVGPGSILVFRRTLFP